MAAQVDALAALFERFGPVVEATVLPDVDGSDSCRGVVVLEDTSMCSRAVQEMNGHQLEGMACVGLAPRIFQTRSKRFGTPVNAMLFQLVLLVFLVGLDFRAILCAPAVPAEPSLPRALHSRAPEPRSSLLPGASTISSRPSQICSSSLRAYRCAIASLTCLAPSASGVRIGWSWP